jgi:hypothetical protein
LIYFFFLAPPGAESGIHLQTSSKIRGSKQPPCYQEVKPDLKQKQQEQCVGLDVEDAEEEDGGDEEVGPEDHGLQDEAEEEEEEDFGDLDFEAKPKQRIRRKKVRGYPLATWIRI